MSLSSLYEMLSISFVLTVRDVRDELVDRGGYATGDYAYSSP